MKKPDIITKMLDLEDTMRQVRPISPEFHDQLLQDYQVCVWALKSVSDSYPWEKAIQIEERCQELDNKVVTDEEFEEYSFLLVILGALYEEMPRRLY